MNHRVRPVVSWLLVLAVLLALTGVAQARPGPQSPGPVRVYGRDLALTPKPLRPVAVPPDPVVQAMIDQVSATVVYSYTGDLSGEWPVLVGGAPYTIATRHTNSGTPVAKATQFVGEHLAAQGLDVEYHVWDASRPPNVIGELPGLTNPDDVYIICGHLDDMPSGGLAPGADDNASGSVAVLIAADILTQYQWGCTLRFALWTGEEQGLLGSAAYAARCHDNGENILGVLNLDMIAWNTPSSSPDIDLHAKSTIPATLTLAQLFADVVDAYNLNLVPQIVPNGTGASDHASFWTYGYTAILGIEDGNDFNPRYHTTGDQLQYLDMAYYTDFVKAAIATFVHMSGCLIPGGLGALDGHVTAAGGSVPIVGATVTADDGAGHAYPATTDAVGYYTRTLLADTYTVTASAFGYLPSTLAGVAITTDTVTTQDFALAMAPTHTISGAVTEAGTGTPLYAQVTAADTPLAPAWTDPATGHYALTVPEGTYTLRVSAALRRPAERVVVADHDQVQDFALEPLPCILLVDDDNDAPDVRPYYIAALDSLGYDYDVFDVGGGAGNGPSLAEMTGYTIVIWFSGDKYGSGDSAGPNAADEANLTAYLDGGGRLFLSSQDYLYDMGLTAFGQDYLGVGSHTSDAGDATAKYGVAGDPVGAGLGPYTLTYPPDFSDYGDIVNAGTGASVAFQSAESGGNNLDVDRDGGNWQTVFFGTSWVPIYTHSAANGQQVLQRIVEWLGGCGCTVLTGVTLAQTTPGPVYPGDAVAFSAGTAPADAHKPYSYRLTVDGVPGPVQSSSANPLAFSRTFATTGTHQVAIAAWNCVLTEPDAVTDVVQVEVACRELSGVTIAGASSGTPGAYTFIAAYAPANAMPPISYQWDNGDATAASVRTLGLGTHTLAVTATNCAGALVTDTHIVVISPVCTPALAVDLVLGTAGIVYTDTVAQFRASIVPADASPYTYVVYANGAVIIGPHTGSANPLAFTHVFGLAGAYTVEVRVEDCSLVAPVSDAVVVTVRRGDWYYAYLPLVLRDE